jgi:hypothetical protein
MILRLSPEDAQFILNNTPVNSSYYQDWKSFVINKKHQLSFLGIDIVLDTKLVRTTIEE